MRKFTHTLLLLLASLTTYCQNDFELVIWYLKCHEGYRINNYKCTAGAKTIGWGTQSKKKQVTRKEAQFMLYTHFEKDYQVVKTSYPKLQKRQHLILAALMYNVGNIGKDLDYRIRQGLPVSPAWIQYNKVKGKTADYLLKRRVVEIDIFNGVNLRYYYDQFKECTCNQSAYKPSK